MRLTRLAFRGCCSLAFLLLALLLVAPAIVPASADLLSDLLSGRLGDSLGGNGRGNSGGGRNHPQRNSGGYGGGGGGAHGGNGVGGGGGGSGDSCDSYICPHPHHHPLSKPHWIPTSNGCGSYGFRIASQWHEGCCDAHDKCYGTCGKRRDQCDSEFQSCMNQQCSRLLHRDRQAHSDCEGQASMFFTFTRSLGCSTFQDSQREACTCTPIQKAMGAVKDAAAAVNAGVQRIKQQVQDEL